MDPNSSTSALLGFVAFFAFLIPAIFFLLSQQGALQIVRPVNRRMLPGLVWLQLIPLFGQLWQFFVVARISDSLSKEFATPNDDSSILGISDMAAIELNNRPTLGIGIAYCILSTTGIVMNVLALKGIALSVATLLNLAGMICWIVYWVKLAGCKRKLTVAKVAGAAV